MPRSHHCPSISTTVPTSKVATLRKSTVVMGSLAVTWVSDCVINTIKDNTKVEEPDVIVVPNPSATSTQSSSPAWRLRRCRVDLSSITSSSPSPPKQARSDLVHGRREVEISLA